MEIAGGVGLWKVVAASVRGRRHEEEGCPCQDAHAWDRLGTDGLLAAVADGAGSARLAEIGSTLATQSALAALRERQADLAAISSEEAWQRISQEAMRTALEAVRAEAERLKAPPGDLATTLTVLVAHSGKVAAAQIGDGASLLQDAEGRLIPLTLPSNAEYINETTFLTSNGAIEAASHAVWAGAIKSVALMTDGLEMVSLKMPEGQIHPGFFRPLFQFAAEPGPHRNADRELAEFLSSARVRERTDDDLTLVLGHFIAR